MSDLPDDTPGHTVDWGESKSNTVRIRNVMFGLTVGEIKKLPNWELMKRPGMGRKTLLVVRRRLGQDINVRVCPACGGPTNEDGFYDPEGSKGWLKDHG